MSSDDEYREYRGYLVRSGPTVRECGFVLPNQRKDFEKAEYKSSKQNKSEHVSTSKEKLLEAIRNEIKRHTDGFPQWERDNWIRERFNVAQPHEVKGKSESYLERRLEYLKKTVR